MGVTFLQGADVGGNLNVTVGNSAPEIARLLFALLDESEMANCRPAGVVYAELNANFADVIEDPEILRYLPVSSRLIGQGLASGMARPDTRR